MFAGRMYRFMKVAIENERRRSRIWYIPIILDFYPVRNDKKQTAMAVCFLCDSPIERMALVGLSLVLVDDGDELVE